MKNLSTKITLALVFCTLAIAQVSAEPVTSLKIEKNDCQLIQKTEAFSKISCFKSWFLSYLNKKDYVAEDSLLNNYMLGRVDEPIQITYEQEEELLSNYMYGENSSSIAYSPDSQNISFAADFDDENFYNDIFEE